MQAVGMVNDHLMTSFRPAEVRRLAATVTTRKEGTDGTGVAGTLHQADGRAETGDGRGTAEDERVRSTSRPGDPGAAGAEAGRRPRRRRTSAHRRVAARHHHAHRQRTHRKAPGTGVGRYAVIFSSSASTRRRSAASPTLP